MHTPKVAMPRWKKRLAWVLGIPLGMALVGWVAEAITLNRLNAAISSEEVALEKLGIRTKKFRPDEDARPLYRRFLKRIAEKEGSNSSWLSITTKTIDGPQDDLFQLYKAASSMPFLSEDDFQKRWKDDLPFFEQVVGEWVQGRALALAKAHDWAQLNELTTACQRAYYQTAFQSTTFELTEISIQPITSLRHSGPEARNWLKKRVASMSWRDSEVAEAGGALLALRYPRQLAKLHLNHPPPTWWERTARNHPIAQKMYELELLRTTRSLFQDRRDRQSSLIQETFASDLYDRLHRKNSWIVKTFSGNVSMAFTVFPTPEHERRNLLIELDLREAMDEGRPLKSTWSKSLCVDPSTGIQVTVTIKGRTVKIGSPNPLCNWDSTFKLD